MKKTILVLLMVLFAVSLAAQVKKPTLMVVPSDNWCVKNGFVLEKRKVGNQLVKNIIH